MFHIGHCKESFPIVLFIQVPRYRPLLELVPAKKVNTFNTFFTQIQSFNLLWPKYIFNKSKAKQKPYKRTVLSHILKLTDLLPHLIPFLTDFNYINPNKNE